MCCNPYRAAPAGPLAAPQFFSQKSNARPHVATILHKTSSSIQHHCGKECCENYNFCTFGAFNGRKTFPMETYNFVIIVIAAVNLLSFTLFGIDKWKAKRHLWRIPESVLLLSAAIGGSIGALLAMFLFRHKTQHKKFTVGVPLILALQITLALLIK